MKIYDSSDMVGLSWLDDKGREFRTYPRKGRDLKVILSISSWVGFSIGAMHYYARIKVPGPVVHHPGEENATHGGYLGKNAPEGLGVNYIDCERRLTKVERDMSGDIIGKIGDYTSQFNTEREAALAGLETLSKRFTGDWTFEYENLDGDTFQDKDEFLKSLAK